MLHTALNVLALTVPVYLLIGTGWLAVRSGALAAADVRAVGRFVVTFCVPALLFRAMSQQRPAQVVQPDYLAVYALGSLAAAALVAAASRWGFRRSVSVSALQALGSANSNSAFVGLPIVLLVVGPQAGAALALCMLVENLMIIPAALATADAGQHDGHPRAVLAATFKALARNPIILAMVAGLAVGLGGHPLPPLVDRTVTLAAGAAPPTALFVIGGTLVGIEPGGMKRELVLVAGGKLLLHPLCVALAMLWVRPADAAMRGAAVLFASMPMLSIYPVLAQRYGHERFCAAALLAATSVSFVTLNALILALPAAWVPLR